MEVHFFNQMFNYLTRYKITLILDMPLFSIYYVWYRCFAFVSVYVAGTEKQYNRDITSTVSNQQRFQ